MHLLRPFQSPFAIPKALLIDRKWACRAEIEPRVVADIHPTYTFNTLSLLPAIHPTHWPSLSNAKLLISRPCGLAHARAGMIEIAKLAPLPLPPAVDRSSPSLPSIALLTALAALGLGDRPVPPPAPGTPLETPSMSGSMGVRASCLLSESEGGVEKPSWSR